MTTVTRIQNGKKSTSTVSQWQHDYATYMLEDHKSVVRRETIRAIVMTVTTIIVLAVCSYGFACLLAYAIHMYQ